MHIYNGELLHGKHKLANKMMTMHKLFIDISVCYACLPTFIQFKEKFSKPNKTNQWFQWFQNIKVGHNILTSSKSQNNTTQIRNMQCVETLCQKRFYPNKNNIDFSHNHNFSAIWLCVSNKTDKSVLATLQFDFLKNNHMY